MSAAHSLATPTLPVAPPRSWAKSPRTEYLGCAVCTHGQDDTGRPCRGHPSRAASHCACPAVTGGRAPVPVPQARANHGACGPEAAHQAFPGLR